MRRCHPQLARVSEIAEALDLTEYTVFKLLKTARQSNLLVSSRGRGGGIRLGFDPELMSVGHVVRAFEPRFQKCEPAMSMAIADSPIEEFDLSANEAIGRGLNAFLNELDSIRITDLLDREVTRRFSH